MKKSTWWSFVLVLLMGIAQAWAISPGTELFFPSVGRGQGACPGGICSQWRTDIWIFNTDDSNAASVTLSFLERKTENSSPVTAQISVLAGQALELTDVMESLFSLDGKFGALRLSSDRTIVATSRIYDANVQTNLGSGTAGQFFGAFPTSLALGQGETTELLGLAQDSGGTWRTNFGFVEITGQSASVNTEIYNSAGTLIGSRSFDFGGYGVGQISLGSLGISGSNLRVHISVGSGPGQVLAFASRIDSRTGDPSTIEMVTTPSATAHTSGVFAGTVNTPDDTRMDGGLQLNLSDEGVTSFSGTTGISCDQYEFTVDFLRAEGGAAVLGSDGSFEMMVSQTYNDGGIPIFDIQWTLSGTLDSEGVFTGSLSDTVSNGAGSWSSCNGSATRSWTAAWVSE